MSPPEEPRGEGEVDGASEDATPQQPVAPLQKTAPDGIPLPPPAGLNLEQYAAGKGLDVEFLRGIGLSTIHINGLPVLRIPYFGSDGEIAAVRFRYRLEEGDGPRFTWRKGDKPRPYGQERLGLARDAGLIFLVEGESDAHTLWQHEVPALGIPGARAWNEERDAPLLDGIDRVYVVIEPDTGGDAVLAWLERSAICDRVQIISLSNKEDA